MINDTCVHDFDLARALLDPADEPVSIVAYGSTVIDAAACKEAGDVMRVCITMATRAGVLLSITSKSVPSFDRGSAHRLARLQIHAAAWSETISELKRIALSAISTLPTTFVKTTISSSPPPSPEALLRHGSKLQLSVTLRRS